MRYSPMLVETLGNVLGLRKSARRHQIMPIKTLMPNCPICSKEFTPLKTWGKYCSRKCGDIARMRAYRERRKPKDPPPPQS